MSLSLPFSVSFSSLLLYVSSPSLFVFLSSISLSLFSLFLSLSLSLSLCLAFSLPLSLSLSLCRSPCVSCMFSLSLPFALFLVPFQLLRLLRCRLELWLGLHVRLLRPPGLRLWIWFCLVPLMGTRVGGGSGTRGTRGLPSAGVFPLCSAPLATRSANANVVTSSTTAMKRTTCTTRTRQLSPLVLLLLLLLLLLRRLPRLLLALIAIAF